MENKNRVLVTGGLGYIGSHTCVALIEAGYHPVVVDNLVNSKIEVKKAIEEITGQRLEFYEIDVKEEELVKKNLGTIDYIIHFAGLKSVAESIDHPSLYYNENLRSLLSIINIANEFDIKTFIFSSSASVYGKSDVHLVNEEMPLCPPLNPYAHTKQIGETLLYHTFGKFKSILLRYFNPIGAHPSLKIGESPAGSPNNLVPILTDTALGKRDQFHVFGDDYDTKDGSCVRDFIHVCDLAEAHVRSLDYGKTMNNNFDVFNVGTGHGTSVFELLDMFRDVSRIKLKWELGSRRTGDIPALIAETKKINNIMGWANRFTVEQALLHSWEWAKSR